MATTIARGEMLHDLLIEELNHRVKNTLAILQAIAAQTFSQRHEVPNARSSRAGSAHLPRRIISLSREKWQGSDLAGGNRARAAALPAQQPGPNQKFGPNVPLSPRLAVVLSMIIHDDGDQRRQIRRAVERDGHGGAGLGGSQRGGCPQATADLDRERRPACGGAVRRGFGSRLIERSARDQLGGEATVDFLPRGVVYTIICALQREG